MWWKYQSCWGIKSDRLGEWVLLGDTLRCEKTIPFRRSSEIVAAYPWTHFHEHTKWCWVLFQDLLFRYHVLVLGTYVGWPAEVWQANLFSLLHDTLPTGPVRSSAKHGFIRIHPALACMCIWCHPTNAALTEHDVSKRWHPAECLWVFIRTTLPCDVLTMPNPSWR